MSATNATITRKAMPAECRHRKSLMRERLGIRAQTTKPRNAPANAASDGFCRRLAFDELAERRPHRIEVVRLQKKTDVLPGKVRLQLGRVAVAGREKDRHVRTGFNRSGRLKPAPHITSTTWSSGTRYSSVSSPASRPATPSTRRSTAARTLCEAPR